MRVQLHRIARAYGMTPGDVLRLDPDDLALCMSCVQAADEMLERVEMVFPVVTVGA